MGSSAKSTIGIKLDEQQEQTVAALGYIFTPIVPIVTLASDMRNSRFLRNHAVQALLWSGPFLVLLGIMIVIMVLLVSRDFLWILVTPILIVVPFLPGMFWARKVYLGQDVRIPVIGDFVRF